MKYLETYITLNQLKFYAYHGVSPQETKVGNTFIIDIKLKVGIVEAIETDNLNYTVNYAEIYEAIKSEMETPSKLLEHVSGRIIKRLFHDFESIENIELKLSKQNPPMGADTAGAGIIIHAER